MTVAAKPDLRELGTRYDHYMEMKEVFMEGIATIDRLDPRYHSDIDKANKKNFEIIVAALGKRIEYLAAFEDKTSWESDLQKDLRAIAKTVKRPLLLPPPGAPTDTDMT